MKKNIFLTLALLLIVGCATTPTPKNVLEKKEADFSGNWEMLNSNPKETVFTLSLWQEGSNIKGSHCVEVNDSQKIDCFLPDSSHREYNIQGSVENNVGVVKVLSGYRKADANVELSLNNGILHWKIIKNFEDGNEKFFVPLEADFIKK